MTGSVAESCILSKLYSYNFRHSKKIYGNHKLLSIILGPNLIVYLDLLLTWLSVHTTRSQILK